MYIIIFLIGMGVLLLSIVIVIIATCIRRARRRLQQRPTEISTIPEEETQRLNS